MAVQIVEGETTNEQDEVVKIFHLVDEDTGHHVVLDGEEKDEAGNPIPRGAFDTRKEAEAALRELEASGH